MCCTILLRLLWHHVSRQLIIIHQCGLVARYFRLILPGLQAHRHLDNFGLRRKTTLHCRNGSRIIKLRRLDAGLNWLSAKAERRYGMTLPLRRHEYSFRLNFNASCSTVCTNWLIQAWKLEWVWSSDHIGGNVLAVMCPNGRRLVKPVKRLKCTSILNRCLNDYLLQANDLVTFTLTLSVRSIRHAKGRTFCLQSLPDRLGGRIPSQWQCTGRGKCKGMRKGIDTSVDCNVGRSRRYYFGSRTTVCIWSVDRNVSVDGYCAECNH